MTFCAGIPFRIGHGIILFHAITGVWPVMTRKFKKGRNEAEYGLDLVRAMGVRTDNPAPEIHLSREEELRVEDLRRKWQGRPAAGPEPPREFPAIVGLHTTSGGSSPNWTPGRWADLARLLVDSGRVNEVPPEVDGIKGVAYPDRDQQLRVTVTSIAALDVLVSASTGPMHLAGALGVPTLSLFCPLPSCEPALWGPLGNEARFILPEEEYCRDECPGNPHVCDFSGSRQVSPGAVARQILSQLSSSS